LRIARRPKRWRNRKWQKRRCLGKRNYKDGKEDGLFEMYHDNGQLGLKGNHKDGKQNGLWEMYSSDGQLWSTICYDNGEKVDMSYCEK
jgi:antitoxin component YwqK of YwqJK toxin-antitoxin module